MGLVIVFTKTRTVSIDFISVMETGTQLNLIKLVKRWNFTKQFDFYISYMYVST